VTTAAAFIIVAALYLLHQDIWFWREARPLVFGVLPIGLFYHAAFTVATTGALWLLVKFAWPAHLETALTTSDLDQRPETSDQRPPIR
jgi:hypothetical protein